jgi:hypothetical protein
MMRRALALVIAITAMTTARAQASGFDETMQDVQRQLLSVDRPGLPLPNNEPRLSDRREILAREPGEPERRLRLFRDLQVRRGSTAAQLMGSGLPVDVVSGVLPGTLMAMRVGGEARGVGGYFIFGGGSFTTYRHTIPRRDVDPLLVDTRSMAFGFLGFGTELRLYRELVLAGEVNWGNILDQRDADRIIAPGPGNTVRSAAIALRVDY